MRCLRQARVIIRTGLLAIFWATMPASALAYHLPVGGDVDLEVSGRNTLALNLSQVDGSQAYYSDDNYDRADTFTHSSDLYLTGRLMDDLYLDARVVADRFSPSNTRWTLRYDGGSADVLLGEFAANLGGNEFVLLNRSLLGVQVDANLRRGTLTALTSQLRSPVRTDTFYGRNVSGPYYLSAAPILDSSEVVTLNNERKERYTDYTLDYRNGILTFSPAIIVGPADRVTVSYEVQVSGAGGGGQLYALRAAYPVLPGLEIGVSHLQLEGRNVGDTEQEHRDQYLGDDTPGPLYLTYRPVIQGSEVVTINGVLQPRGTAYTIDYAAGRILFRSGFEPPRDSTVVVRYRVSVPSNSGSERSVSGVDMSWQAGKGLQLNVQAAQSSGPTTQEIPPEQISNEPFVVQPGIPVTQQLFHLRKAPVQEGSETVRAVTVTLIRGQDYLLNYQTGELRVLVDTIPISPTGPSLFVSYSTVGQTIHLVGDSALAAAASYQWGRLMLTTGYRQVDPGFSPLEMVGFRRTQQRLEWMTTYTFTDALSFSMTGDNTRQPYNPYVVTPSEQILMDEQNRTYTLTYSRPKQPTVTLRRATTQSNQVGGGALGDSTSADSLLIGWSRNNLAASLNFTRTDTDSRRLLYSQDPYSPLPDNPDPSNPVFAYNATRNNASLNLSYHPSDRLSAGLALARNDIATRTSDGETSTSGSSVQGNATYRLTATVSLTANLTTNRTDAAKTAAGGDVPALTSRDLLVSANWRPADSLDVNLSYSSDRYQGGEYSNSASHNLSANARWQATPWAVLNGYWFNQRLRYLSASGSSRSRMIGVGAELKPFKKVIVNLDAQRITGDSAAGVSQLWQAEGRAQRAAAVSVDESRAPVISGNKLTTLSGKVTYPISGKHDLFVTGETSRSSGFPSDSQRNAYGLGWNYHLSDNLTFTLDAKRLTYDDRANPAINYRAGQMNAQFAWNF